MHTRLLLITWLCVLSLAAPAAAQAPQVDPGSPAGTEYQLPIDRAREEAAAGTGGVTRSGGAAPREAPLFGAGVEAATPSRAKPSAAGDSRADATTRDGGPDEGARVPDAVRAQVAAPDRTGGGLLAIGAGGGCVLLLGGLAGWAWRRLR